MIPRPEGRPDRGSPESCARPDYQADARGMQQKFIPKLCIRSAEDVAAAGNRQGGRRSSLAMGARRDSREAWRLRAMASGGSKSVASGTRTCRARDRSGERSGEAVKVLGDAASLGCAPLARRRPAAAMRHGKMMPAWPSARTPRPPQPAVTPYIGRSRVTTIQPPRVCVPVHQPGRPLRAFPVQLMGTSLEGRRSPRSSCWKHASGMTAQLAPAPG